MSEILNAIKLKDKVTIVTVMAAFAVLLATCVGLITYFTADRHTHVYDYSLQMEEDGSFSVVGVCNVNNCENPYYRQENLSGVTLLSAVSPTCSKEGKRVYSYTAGAVTLKYTEVIPKAAHLYEYEIVDQNDVLYINGKCKAEGCENPLIFIRNVEDLTLVSVVEGTCFSLRQETYSYVSNGVSGTFVTLVDEDIPHTLCGVAADTLQNDNGEYIYGTDGVKLLSLDGVACGALSDGYFVCEVCRQIEVIKVRHPDHKFVYNEADLIAPTPEADGFATLKCENSNCSATHDVTIPKVEEGVNAVVKSEATELRRRVVTYTFESEEFGFTVQRDYEVGELLSHKYVYELVLNKTESGRIDTENIDLVGRCHQPECQTPEIREKDVDTTFEDTSTCLQAGCYIWTYEKDGELLVLEVISTEPGPHRYSFEAENAKDPTLNSAGEILLYCTTEGCDHSVTVELPKIVIGENATQINEAEDYIIVEYIYDTEFKCTVNLKILIYKKNLV